MLITRHLWRYLFIVIMSSCFFNLSSLTLSKITYMRLHTYLIMNATDNNYLLMCPMNSIKKSFYYNFFSRKHFFYFDEEIFHRIFYFPSRIVLGIINSLISDRYPLGKFYLKSYRCG